MKLFSLLLLSSLAYGALVSDVRSSLASKNYAQAEALLAKYRQEKGVTPELAAAASWLGRAALAEKKYEQAEKYSTASKAIAVEALKKGKLDADPNSELAIGLGASIEVMGQALAGQGQRAEAVEYLKQELAAYRATAVRTRIQKNINLLSLEGKPAPALELKTSLGTAKVPTLASLKGKPVLLFFWAHWCGDCKNEVNVVAKLREDYAAKGLTVIGPTQRYGYADGGRDVGQAEEMAYIEKVRQRYYTKLLDMPAPVSEENFRNYGASTTPTLVLIDRKGIVKLYRPGSMSYDELKAHIDPL